MTEERLQEIRARCEVATPGPWEGQGETGVDSIGFNQTFDRDYNIYPPLEHSGPVAVASSPEVALFVIHARQDIPDLLDEVERLQAALAEYANPKNWGMGTLPRTLAPLCYYTGPHVVQNEGDTLAGWTYAEAVLAGDSLDWSNVPEDGERQ